MLVAVVPAQNEEKRIERALNHLLFVGVTNIVAVVNGSTDNTFKIIKKKYPQVQTIYFKDPLGIDIPRGVGSSWALKNGATDILFFDGDLNGEITSELTQLIKVHLFEKFDLTLTNCYPLPLDHETIPKKLLYPRLHLNETIGLDKSLGISNPCHGPHIITRNLFQSLDLLDLGVPPVVLAWARKKGFRVGIGTCIPEVRLGSKIKTPQHSVNIYNTLWGDCAEAISVFLNIPRNRFFYGTYYNGYNSERRFDILKTFIKNMDS